MTYREKIEQIITMLANYDYDEYGELHCRSTGELILRKFACGCADRAIREGSKYTKKKRPCLRALLRATRKWIRDGNSRVNNKILWDEIDIAYGEVCREDIWGTSSDAIQSLHERCAGTAATQSLFAVCSAKTVFLRSSRNDCKSHGRGYAGPDEYDLVWDAEIKYQYNRLSKLAGISTESE